VRITYYKSVAGNAGSGGSVPVFSGYGARTSFSIATGAVQDLTPPQLVSVTPQNNSTNVSTNAVVTFVFSEAMQATSDISITWSANVRKELFFSTWSPDGKTLSFSNPSRLPPGALIVWTLNPAGSAATLRDLAGNPLADGLTGQFTTEGVAIPLQLNLGAFPYSDSALQFGVSGIPFLNATVETSTDLKTWVTLTNRVVAAPPTGAILKDTLSGPGPRRFYRAHY
jgi:hypothetical protein